MTDTLDPRSWLYPTPRGLYCQPGDFYIDPAVAVSRALITHGHGDHARPGHRAALATPVAALVSPGPRWLSTTPVFFLVRA